MHRRDLTPILPPTQHPCMQPPSTTHSHPPHGLSAKLIKVCSRNIPLRVCADTRDGVCLTWVWIANPGALPIIASVSPQPIPCLFACFYNSVWYVYTFFSNYLSACVVSAACFVFAFYLHVYYSDSCVCASKQAYAFPFSSIFVHISRHIHTCCFGILFYIYTFFMFSFFFFRNTLDTSLTVSIDVISPSKYPYPPMPFVFPLCILYIHHLTDWNQNDF